MFAENVRFSGEHLRCPRNLPLPLGLHLLPFQHPPPGLAQEGGRREASLASRRPSSARVRVMMVLKSWVWETPGSSLGGRGGGEGGGGRRYREKRRRIINKRGEKAGMQEIRKGEQGEEKEELDESGEPKLLYFWPCRRYSVGGEGLGRFMRMRRIRREWL